MPVLKPLSEQDVRNRIQSVLEYQSRATFLLPGCLDKAVQVWRDAGDDHVAAADAIVRVIKDHAIQSQFDSPHDEWPVARFTGGYRPREAA